MSHTPAPYRIVRREALEDENQIANVRGINIVGPYHAASCTEDAEFIIRACNSHALLLDACKYLCAEIQNRSRQEHLIQCVAEVEKVLAKPELDKFVGMEER